ncbi:MAG TPA: hypothetical protein VF837_02970 [Patescibacteria group bacterium]
MNRIVTDFDGTVTDVQREAESFYCTYVCELANKIHLNENDLDELMENAKLQILKNPGLYGWIVDGVIVAPGTADPYLFTQSAARIVLESLKGKNIPPQEEWEALFNELFALAYPRAGVYFRPWALEYIRTLDNRAELVVVTNSSTTSVTKKLAILLGDDQNIRVLGNAKKFKLDPTWEEVPEKYTPKGFPRPVYLRRKMYADIFTLLGDVDGVCGDIWELDLCLPERFGIPTALILSDTTAPWEKAHYINHPNGLASDSLQELAFYLLTR